jgi:hypothetical protein
MTMTLISTVTVGAGGAASIEWTGIAQTATDLMIVLSCRNTGSGNSLIFVQPNSISTASYTMRLLRGESTVTSSTGTGLGVNYAFIAGYTGGSNLTANTFTSAQIYIPNYASTANKSLSSEYSKETNDSVSYENGLSAGSLTTSSAITSVKLTLLLSGDTFAQYSSASLYTITKGSGGATVS